MRTERSSLGDDGRPQHRSFVVERADIEIVDTWHVSGLQGTGSTDFKIGDLFVPDNRVFVVGAPAAPNEPIFSFPMFGFLGIGIAAVALGAAQAALDDILGLVKRKGSARGATARWVNDRRFTARYRNVAHGHIQAGRSYFYQSIDNALGIPFPTGGKLCRLTSDVTSERQRPMRSTEPLPQSMPCIDWQAGLRSTRHSHCKGDSATFMWPRNT